MDFSLFALKNYFLAAGLGFFSALLISKKKAKNINASLQNSGFADNTKGPDTRINKKYAFLKGRIIRILMFLLYLCLFFASLSYKKLSLSLVWTFLAAVLIFFAFFKLKKLVGSLFVLLIALLIAFTVLFNRSLYILFHEEVIGKIKIVKMEKNHITLNVSEIDNSRIIKEYKNMKVKGRQFGVFTYRLFYKKWLSFIGLEHKLYWAGVIGLIISDVDSSGRANASAEIVFLDPLSYIKNEKVWKMVEKRELILPGVRNVQKDFVFKSPVLNRVYKIIKHRTGVLTIEPEL